MPLVDQHTARPPTGNRVESSTITKPARVGGEENARPQSTSSPKRCRVSRWPPPNAGLVVTIVQSSTSTHPSRDATAFWGPLSDSAHSVSVQSGINSSSLRKVLTPDPSKPPGPSPFQKIHAASCRKIIDRPAFAQDACVCHGRSMVSLLQSLFHPRSDRSCARHQRNPPSVVGFIIQMACGSSASPSRIKCPHNKKTLRSHAQIRRPPVA